MVAAVCCLPPQPCPPPANKLNVSQFVLIVLYIEICTAKAAPRKEIVSCLPGGPKNFLLTRIYIERESEWIEKINLKTFKRMSSWLFLTHSGS